MAPTSHFIRDDIDDVASGNVVVDSNGVDDILVFGNVFDGNVDDTVTDAHLVNNSTTDGSGDDRIGGVDDGNVVVDDNLMFTCVARIRNNSDLEHNRGHGVDDGDIVDDDSSTGGDAVLIDAARNCERASGGRLSVAALNVTTGAAFHYRARRRCKSASVIKLPILVHIAASVEEGSLSWDQRTPLKEEEKVGGAGVLGQLAAGLDLSLRDICTLMIIISDNTATNMLIELVGVEAVNDRMRSIGLFETQLFRKSYNSDTEASRPYGLGVATPHDKVELLLRLSQGTAVSTPACVEILRILSKQTDRNGIPRLLDETWQFRGKSGAIDSVRNDVGIVTTPEGRKMIAAIFCNDLEDLRWSPNNAGQLAIAEMSRSLAHHWFASTPEDKD